MFDKDRKQISDETEGGRKIRQKVEGRFARKVC